MIFSMPTRISSNVFELFQLPRTSNLAGSTTPDELSTIGRFTFVMKRTVGAEPGYASPALISRK